MAPREKPDTSWQIASTGSMQRQGDEVLYQLTNKYDPSARPQTEFLCKPIRRIMEEKSIKRNHGVGLVEGAMIEKRSLRRNH